MARRTFFLTFLLALVLTLTAAALSSARASAAATDVCAQAAPGHAQCDAQIIPRAHAAAAPQGRAQVKQLAAVSSAPVPAPAAGTPLYLQQAYDLTALSASRGAGDTVAIVDAFSDPNAASDLATYRAHYGLPACTGANGCLKIVNQNATAAPLPAANRAWATEITEDLDAVSAICPNCSIDLVEANSSTSADLRAAMQAAAGLGANQISDSWSIVANRSPFGTSVPQMLKRAHAPAVIAATGDVGEVTGASNAYPAALPDVTAVGGTSLEGDATTSRGFVETPWASAGYGCDSAESALAYAPSTGCAGRAYADVSADADPNTGLSIYEAATGGWALGGGTSVATPMVAAYEALTRLAGSTNQWAYRHAGQLNRVSGSYAGQTGLGSISGDVITGAPGTTTPTVSALSATSVTLTAGLYTNGESTSVSWQYGASSSYSAATPSVALAAASGASPVSTTIANLAPNSTYHVRLLAHNAAGTTYGYDVSFTTAS